MPGGQTPAATQSPPLSVPASRSRSPRYGPAVRGGRKATYIEVVMKPILSIPLVLALVGAGPAAGQDHAHTSPAGEKLGTVHFATSCTPAAQPAFDRAVSLLHSF